MANFLKSLFIKGVEIDTTGASNGNVLSYNGTKFAPAAPGSGSLALDDLSDVVVTSPEEFQGISYNGTSWVNGYIPLVSYVRNAETTTLTTGTCVYLYGSTGDHATVKRADNTSDTTSSKTIGVVGANITASNNGPVITRGYVDGIDLSTGYTAGDVLWLGTNGAFTKTKPTAPDHLVFIGVVVRATNNGIIYVATQNGYELDEIHNVSLPSPQSGEFLKYNGSLWVADAIDLGTDTTGSYVASLVAGTGISLANNSGEGATPTITNSGVTSINTTLTGNVTGVVTTSDTGTVTSTMIADGTIVNSDINASAAIALSKLASGTSGQVVIANGTGVPTYTTISGDITISSTGVATIAADSVALGTDTTGNYMSGISGTSPVSVSHTPSEGSSATVSLASGYGDTQNPYASKTANFFLAAPNGSAGVPTFRAVVAADIPTLNQSTTGNAATATTLQTSRNINGVAFNGSADITVTAAAGTLTGTTLASGVTASSLTSVGTITSGTWSGSFGAVSGANLTSLNASNISSGTLASARISGSYTGITAVGTLTSLTTSGTLTYSLGSLGTTSGTVITAWSVSATTSNTDVVSHKIIRRTPASGQPNTSWETAYHRIQRTVDVTDQGFIQFGVSGNGSAVATTVELGVGSTSSFVINPGAGTISATGTLGVSSDVSAANFIATNYLISTASPTGSGNAAQWLGAFGQYYLVRNTSTRDDKENIQPLDGALTPAMVDEINITMWNRKTAPGIPEVGPMAEDMDSISPFLSTKGMDVDSEGNIITTPPNGINQNSWLSLLTIALQDAREQIRSLTDRIAVLESN